MMGRKCQFPTAMQSHHMAVASRLRAACASSTGQSLGLTMQRQRKVEEVSLQVRSTSQSTPKSPFLAAAQSYAAVEALTHRARNCASRV